VAWLQALDRRGRVTAVPFQKPGVIQGLGLTAEDCHAAAWAVEPNGTRYRGAAGIIAALSWATGLREMVHLYRLPVLRWLLDEGYEGVARWRARLPGVGLAAEWGELGCEEDEGG
jgi:predicted DCC family thiol-disulfide oxidoreductase YuxK